MAFKQNDFFLPRLGKTAVFVWSLEMDFLKRPIPKGVEGKPFQIYEALNNGNRNIVAENGSLLDSAVIQMTNLQTRW